MSNFHPPFIIPFPINAYLLSLTSPPPHFSSFYLYWAFYDFDLLTVFHPRIFTSLIVSSLANSTPKKTTVLIFHPCALNQCHQYDINDNLPHSRCFGPANGLYICICRYTHDPKIHQRIANFLPPMEFVRFLSEPLSSYRSEDEQKGNLFLATYEAFGTCFVSRLKLRSIIPLYSANSPLRRVDVARLSKGLSHYH